MLPFGESLNLTRWQTIQVNEKTFETTVDGVFSGGDVVTGAATAIEAIAAGRKAAYAIDAYIQTGKAKAEPVEFLSRKDSFRKVTTEDLREGPRHARRAMPTVQIEERIHSFVEVEKGYTAADLKLEAARCLECGCTALFDCDLRRYATEYEVDIANFLGEAKQYQVDRRHPLIELDPNKCILCGRCVRICSELVGVAAYGFINRGFNTVVKPAHGRLAAGDRVRDLRPLHRHLPDRRDRGDRAAGQARPVDHAEDADGLRLLRRRLPAGPRDLRRRAGQGLRAGGRTATTAARAASATATCATPNGCSTRAIRDGSELQADAARGGDQPHRDAV